MFSSTSASLFGGVSEESRSLFAGMNENRDSFIFHFVILVLSYILEKLVDLSKTIKFIFKFKYLVKISLT